MGREWLATDDSGTRLSLDNLSTQKWLDGHYAGLAICVEWLNEKATGLFAQRKTNEAVEMQRLADKLDGELRPKMLKRAQEHRDEFPSDLQERKESSNDK